MYKNLTKQQTDSREEPLELHCNFIMYAVFRWSDVAYQSRLLDFNLSKCSEYFFQQWLILIL